MEFNSLNDATVFIRNAIASSMPELAKEIKIIMDDVTIDQVEGWTNQIFDSVVPNSTEDTAEAGFEDTGKWYSAITGEEVGNPIKFLEAGTTWNRGASNIMDTSLEQCNDVIPNKLREYLMSMGVPIE